MIKNDKITDITARETGKWLIFNEITYLDKTGTIRHWESVERQGETGAVAIIPRLKQSGDILLIKQFRPPVQGYVYEFPAGLIEEGATPEETALKELKEETGYIGTVTALIPPCFSSPGLSGEAVYIAMVEIDEETNENKHPVPVLENSEDITTERIAVDKLADFLFQRGEEINIDAKLCCFALGLGFQANAG
jgi:8-oxo-dGTP pyrophosphatase MutT (NUDIX family)